MTLTDNGTTLHLAVGQQFLLDLGSSLEWAVKVADPGIVARVSGALLTKGAQGLYVARKAGTIVVNAIGSPHCASGSVCPMFRLGFSLTIVVG
ncbi:MAG: hypothetical protein ACLQHS_06815 [Candidatus Limnocylindrales bacterium]